ncbi:hypothetical protein ACHAWO_005287 [Cyclotella atomus]|uniref:Cytochrome P450 n=1 Tax=Cyclotella atomus TaxID=382360 RepID=A0ABD3P457_9STRA
MEIYGRMKNINGTGIGAMFTSTGSVWHSKRKAVSPAFSSNQIKRMNMLAVQKVESWIHERLAAANVEDVCFDVGIEMIDIVLSAICKSAFDYEMPRWERDYLRIELEHALKEFARQGVNIFRAKFSWFIPSRQRALQAGKNLHLLCLKIMDEYRKQENKATGTVIQLIMESHEAFPTCDDKAAQLLEFIVRDEQSKLRKSLQQLNPDTWNNSKELEWAIKEGMRLNPVASAGSIRKIGRNITTRDGFTIPKGSTCFLPFMLLFRNPEVFPEPDSFIPSRWENATREQLEAFQPFSLGKQNCVGQSLARAETTSIIARIISEFELSVDESSSISSEFFLTLKPVNAILRARKI